MNVYQSQIITSLCQISKKDWNSCCFNDHTGHNPFLSYQFLSALETSGCATANTGWQAQHIIVRKGATVVGVMPLYLKSHSQGEYVFDHAWANAYHQAGGNYYPKLQSSTPFTPVTGPKLMVLNPGDKQDVQGHLLKTALSLVNKLDISSLHVTFAERQEWEFMADHGFLKRLDQQFHWLNEGYGCFDDFLADLSSRKRKNIRKERRLAVANDIEIDVLSGQDITEDHWDQYFTFYLDTSHRKWGQPYLNRQFFSLLGEKLSDKIVLIMCQHHNKYIAGALNLLSDDTLYGRYWGAIEDHRYLHFEVCYYQAIDYAIRHGLKKVEAGAQGGHKLARGYRPTSTYSAHWISNPPFRKAIADYLTHERNAILADQEFLSYMAPFKKG
ncbi:MAG: GNAT family N-acetyltransferase [Alphaproteobacteria bacterium]|nr:MAG: GNAT family N-acetyltransferase [Alphaproteobacteria bacterium]